MSATVYQCVKVGDIWHLTQEQATPPLSSRGGAYTSCSKWADFKFGYEKRRPTCLDCVKHVAAHEKRQRGTAFDWLADAEGEAPPPDSDEGL